MELLGIQNGKWWNDANESDANRIKLFKKKVPKFSWKKVDPNFRTASAPQIFFLASNNVS